MAEFISELENIMQAEELLFDPTPGFGPYKQYFPSEAVSHPAKMNTKLVEFLVEEFTKEGDTILDPMAGTGSTGVIAALHGRNSILVDIEEKFVKWMIEAKKIVDSIQTLTPKGKIIVLKGDARQLSKILNGVDNIITSPPYADTKKGGEADENKMAERWDKAAEDKDWNTWSKTWKTEGRKRALKSLGSGYSESEENIGNLPVGDIDAVITSPPYSESVNAPNDPERRAERMKKAGLDPKTIVGGKARCGQIDWKYGDGKDNIGNLKHGEIDSIITSPPYANTFSDWDKKSRSSKEGQIPYYSDERFKKKQNIGNIPYYSDDLNSKRSPKPPKGKETYLEAMFKVYSEMFKVLKEGGRAIIVVKPFYRNRKPVDLPFHTYLLLHKAGFKLEKLYKLRLKQDSFWRTLYYRKYPEIPQLRHEYILVCKKGGDAF